MIISKAIEILTDLVNSKLFTPNWDVSDSMKLGIEAMKRIENVRLHPFHPVYSPLPGESMPERDILTVFREPKKTSGK